MQRHRFNAHRPAPAATTPPGALIPLDTRRIRKQALLAYRKTERSLAKVTEQLTRYREHDLPGFSTWCQHTFSDQFSQLRRLQADLRDKQTLAREISDLAYRLGLSELDAYLEFLWRRDNPEAAAEEDRQRQDAARQHEERAEKKRKKNRNADPDAFDFDQDLFDNDHAEDEWGDLDDFFASFMGKRRPRPTQKPEADLKTARELYRAIVRKLHPDHHGKMSDARKHLWDEAQSAWRSHDVATLQNVLDQCENDDIGVGENTAVSTLLHLTRRLKESLRQTRAQLRQLTQKLEWDYDSRKTNPAYVRKVKQVILDDIRLVRFQYDRLARAFLALEQQAARKTRRRKIQPHT